MTNKKSLDQRIKAAEDFLQTLGELVLDLTAKVDADGTVQEHKPGALDTHRLMTWDAAARRWVKKFNGKTYTISCKALNVPDTEKESRQAANRWWEWKKQELIGQGPPVESVENLLGRVKRMEDQVRELEEWKTSVKKGLKDWLEKLGEVQVRLDAVEERLGIYLAEKASDRRAAEQEVVFDPGMRKTKTPFKTPRP